MTREEAIEVFNELKKCYLGGIVDAIDMAIEAMKAQEPQPPIIMNGRRFQIKKCPKCYMTIKADEKPNFCSNCGQAVKWE